MPKKNPPSSIPDYRVEYPSAEYLRVRGLSRIDKHHTHAWFARVYAQHRTNPLTRSFSEGGPDPEWIKSQYDAAVAWLSEQQRKYKGKPPWPLPFNIYRLKSNTTGVPGLGQSKHYGSPVYQYTFKDPKTGKTKNVRWLIDRWPSPEDAKQAAAAWVFQHQVWLLDRYRQMLGRSAWQAAVRYYGPQLTPWLDQMKRDPSEPGPLQPPQPESFRTKKKAK